MEFASEWWLYVVDEFEQRNANIVANVSHVDGIAQAHHFCDRCYDPT
jgi:hypothetical protein